VTVFGVGAAAQPMTVRRMIGYVPHLLSAMGRTDAADDTYCDRIALMHAGEIQATGTPAALKAALGDGAATVAGVTASSLLLPRLAR
jgi:hypothetical protein